MIDSEAIPILAVNSACEGAARGPIIRRCRCRRILILAGETTGGICGRKTVDKLDREVRERVGAGLPVVGLAHTAGRSNRDADGLNEPMVVNDSMIQ
jgi:hypothetical protein